MQGNIIKIIGSLCSNIKEIIVGGPILVSRQPVRFITATLVAMILAAILKDEGIAGFCCAPNSIGITKI